MTTKLEIQPTTKPREIPFSPPDITQAEIDEVVDALRSGWITTGPRVKELERRVAARCGTRRAVCLGSQTACAELTLRILGIGEGDEVIVPAYTYTATASVVAHVGAKIVMVDCAPDSYEMDYGALEAAITPRTKAVIPVDLFGIPCDYDTIFEIAESKRSSFEPADNLVQQALGRVAVVADAAHSFGASYKGSPVGSVADFTNFSFHAVKNLTTAEGGAATWRTIDGVDNEWVYHFYQLMSLHGQSKDAFAKAALGGWEYDVVGAWYKCNMTDVQAALGLAQEQRYDGILARRHEIARAYDTAFADFPVEMACHTCDSYISSAHLYPMRLVGRCGAERDVFIAEMARVGVACNVHYKPLPMMTAYSQMGFFIGEYPNAFRMFENEVTLPLNTCMDDDDVAYVCDAVHGAFAALGW